MAKPPQPLKLQIEDYPDFDKETAEKLFPKLNQFFDEVTSGLDRGLTAQDNLRALVKTIDISVVAASSGVTGSGTAGNLAQWSSSSAIDDAGVAVSSLAPLASPALTGTPTAPTASAGTNTTQVATTAFVTSAVAATGGVTGSGTTNQIAYWSGSGAISGSTNLVYVPASGNLTSAGTVAASKFQLANVGNPYILDSAGNVRFNLISGSSNLYSSPTTNAAIPAHHFDAQTGVTEIATYSVAGAKQLAISSAGKLTFISTDSTASPGAATINKPSGKSAIAAGASAVTITNSLVSASSEVFIQQMDLDGTLTSAKAVPAAGSFTVTGNAAATAAWRFSWWVLN